MKNKRHALYSLGVLVLISLAPLACGSEQTPTASADDPRYTTRGRVESISGEGGARLVSIHHEAIASFRDADGKPSSMASMTMNFSLAEGVAFTASPGEAIEFEFAVLWETPPILLVTKVATLPEGTKLAL